MGTSDPSGLGNSHVQSAALCLPCGRKRAIEGGTGSESSVKWLRLCRALKLTSGCHHCVSKVGSSTCRYFCVASCVGLYIDRKKSPQGSIFSQLLQQIMLRQTVLVTRSTRLGPGIRSPQRVGEAHARVKTLHACWICSVLRLLGSPRVQGTVGGPVPWSRYCSTVAGRKTEGSTCDRICLDVNLTWPEV